MQPPPDSDLHDSDLHDSNRPDANRPDSAPPGPTPADRPPTASAAAPYRLSLAVDGDLLRAQVAGEIDAQAVRMAYWREIVDTARAHRCRRLLVFDRKKGQPASPEELAELAMAFRDCALDFERIAVVEPIAAFLPAIEHGEIQGRLLGINVRIFAEPVDAERWLRFGSADD